MDKSFLRWDVKWNRLSLVFIFCGGGGGGREGDNKPRILSRSMGTSVPKQMVRLSDIPIIPVKMGKSGILLKFLFNPDCNEIAKRG